MQFLARAVEVDCINKHLSKVSYCCIWEAKYVGKSSCVVPLTQTLKTNCSDYLRGERDISLCWVHGLHVVHCNTVLNDIHKVVKMLLWHVEARINCSCWQADLCNHSNPSLDTTISPFATSHHLVLKSLVHREDLPNLLLLNEQVQHTCWNSFH